MTAQLVLFYIFAALALFSALVMVAFVRNVIAGALSLVVTMISLAGIFVLLGAEFVGVVQIMVYAGAIMVLLVFVIMLLNLETDEFGPEPSGRAFAKGVGIAFALTLAAAIATTLPRSTAPGIAEAGSIGGHREIGIALFTDYVLPLEAAGLLLLAGIVGAVILAKRRID